MKKVVIVGGGFAGLNAARELAGTPVGLTIVDRRNFHLFQPLLYQVAAAGLNPSDIAYPIRAIFRRQHNVERIVLAEVTGIDVDARQVIVDDGERIPYDRLVIATGAGHSYFGRDEWASHAPGLKTIEDALDIRGRVLSAFEMAERHPERASQLLTFVVIGAGPTGVEMAGAMMEIAVHALARDFDRIDPTAARVILVEGEERVLPTYPPRLSESACRQLEDLGVDVRLGALAESIDDEGVTLSDDTRIAAATVVWAAGVKASSLSAALDVEKDRAGRIVVGADLSIPGHPEIFVAGDLAARPNVPGVAPAAIQQGRHVARQIIADLAGRPRVPFRYRDRGTVATIGRARAVAHIGPLGFSGFPAWAAWLGIHIFYLIGFRNRLFVIISWAWNYLTFSRGARMITGSPDLPPSNGDRATAPDAAGGGPPG